MNLASPAPAVEPAVADKAKYEEAASARPARPSEAAVASAAATVDPALPYDDPMRYAPAILSKTVERNDLSVDVLRGESGSDFEGYAAVLEGARKKNFFMATLRWMFDERDFVTYGEAKKYVLVKDNTCFVYADTSHPTPLYALPLDNVFAIFEDPDKPDKCSVTVAPVPNTNKPRKSMVTVLLKDRATKEQVHQFTFDTEQDPTMAQRFYDCVQTMKGIRKQPDLAKVSAVPAKK